MAVAVVAAAIGVDPEGLRPFTSLRWLLVSVAVAVAAAAVAFESGRREAVGTRLPRWFVIAGLVVVGSMVGAAVLVGDPATAWLGHPQRHLGVLAWIVFGAAAATGAALSTSPSAARTLGLATVVAAAATGVASVADLLGWSPLGSSFAGGRIGGLLGQPTTLGALAVLLLPVAATAPVAPRTVRLLVVAGLVVTVLGTQTRGAVVGLAAAAIVALPALRSALLPALLPALRAALRPSRALLAVLGITVLLATPLGGRLLSATDSGRMDEWRLAVEVIGDHPLLGVGPEGYRIAVIGVLDDDYVERHGREVVIDRAHSAPLDVAASGGVLAGLAYLVLVAGVAGATWRLQRDEPWSFPAAAGTGALGFLVAGFVAFPTPEVDAVAWLFAGIAVAAAANRRSRAGRSGGLRELAGFPGSQSIGVVGADGAGGRGVGDGVVHAVVEGGELGEGLLGVRQGRVARGAIDERDLGAPPASDVLGDRSLLGRKPLEHGPAVDGSRSTSIGPRSTAEGPAEPAAVGPPSREPAPENPRHRTVIGVDVRPPKDRAFLGGRVAARLGAGLLVAVTLVAGLTDVAADRWLGEAADLRARGRIDDAVASADRATGLRPDLVDGWYVAAQVAAAGPTILDLDAGIARVAAGLDCSPDDPALRELHARLLAERALRSELDRDLVVAVDELDALLADDPTNPTALALRAELAEGRGPASPVDRAGEHGTGVRRCACLTRCETKR